jgi:hypothetical protein
MNKQCFAKYFALGLVLLFLGIATEISAQPAPPDLRTTITQAPTTVMPRSPYQFTVNVRNIGNTHAQSAKLVVDFPLTDTSPQVFILGDLSGVLATQGCSVISRKLNCNLGQINKNTSKNVTFNFAFPISTKTLQIKATASIVSGPADSNLTNNEVSYVPTFNYPVNQITSANVLVSLCTGTSLTSYFECEKFPSSIQHFNMTLDAGGIITNLPDTNYIGNWTQNQTTAPQLFQELQFTITDGTGSGATFSGFASTTNCFEGMTNFIPTSQYRSPYKVCVQ